MRTDASHNLEYLPQRRDVDSSVVAMSVFAFPVLAGAGMAIVAPEWALPAAFAVFLFMWMRRRRRHKRPQAVFHVENGRVRVVGADSRDLLNVPLDDLRNVVLDTRTIQRVQENMSTGLPQLRYINSTVSPELDIARIELKTFTASIFLSEDRFSHTDAVEWLGKIRRFLRAHGWLPEDEREAGSSPPWDS